MTTTLNKFITECTATNHDAPHKAINNGTGPLSPFAQFSVAFRGYSFFDLKQNRLLSKTQVYFRDPILAIGMAITKTIDKRYKLVDSLGWTDGTLN